MNEAIERHIKINPHGFDNTAIGIRLRKSDIDVSLYCDIRDRLFKTLKKERAFNGRIIRELENLEDELENIVDRISDYRGEIEV